MVNEIIDFRRLSGMTLKNKSIVGFFILTLFSLFLPLQASEDTSLDEDIIAVQAPFQEAFDSLDDDNFQNHLHSYSTPKWFIERIVTPYFQDSDIPFEQRLKRAMRLGYEGAKFSKVIFTEERVKEVFNSDDSVNHFILRHCKEMVTAEMAEAYFQRIASYFLNPPEDNIHPFAGGLSPLILCPSFPINDIKKRQILSFPKKIMWCGYSEVRLDLLRRHDLPLSLEEMEDLMKEAMPLRYDGYSDYYHFAEALIQRPDYPLNEKKDKWVSFVTTFPEEITEPYHQGVVKNGQQRVIRALCRFLDLNLPENQEVILSLIKSEEQDFLLRSAAAQGFAKNATVDFDFEARLDLLKGAPSFESLATSFIRGVAKIKNRTLTEEEYDRAWEFFLSGADEIARAIFETGPTDKNGPFGKESIKNDLMAVYAANLLDSSTHDLNIHEQKRLCDILSNCEKRVPDYTMYEIYNLYKAIQKRCPSVAQETLDGILKKFE